MDNINNVDGVLAQVHNDQMNGIPPQNPQVEVQSIPNDPVVSRETMQEMHENDAEIEQKTPQNDDVSRETTQQNVSQEGDSPIDEYGNPVQKEKTYTQEEVNRMIRDRLARGRYAQEQQVERPVQKQEYAPQEDQETDWRKQLEEFVDHRLEQRQRESHEREWRAQEMKRQSDFEDKFTSGMERYSDFRDVVGGRPINDNMMMAIRNLDNPAAFVYGASKLHPQELDRISKINDPYSQAAEMGRLHERMVKERKAASSASKPLETPKSDMATRVQSRPSLETLIDQHAKQKYSRRG